MKAFKTAVLIAALFSISPFSLAGVLSFNISGDASYINSELTPYFSTGDNLNLQFTVDTAVPDGSTDSWFSWYTQLSAMTFSIGNTDGTVPSYIASITDEPDCVTYTCGDVWAAEGKNDFGTVFDFPIFGNYALDIVHLEYRDDSAAALSSDVMADSIDNLSNFTNWKLAFYFKDTMNPGNDRVVISAINPTVTISEVPEPGPLLLLALGLVGLGFVRRKQR
jgi:hypothetical protein